MHKLTSSFDVPLALGASSAIRKLDRTFGSCPQANVNRTYRCGVFSRINLMISAEFGERPACFFE
jgi:hypothetical protein